VRCREDRGQSAVLVLVVALALGIALLAALVDFGGVTQDRARAQTAADAAALASLDGGAVAARDFAARHGATVVSWSRGPGDDEVTVRVRLGDSTATARASNAP
jgi:Flp pilus assembly protein TadG